MYHIPEDHPFRRQAANLSAVRAGLIQAERLHKAAIRQADAAAISYLARMHMIAVGMMAEARLGKTLWDPQGFNDVERKLLVAQNQHERWLLAVDLAFRRHYSVPLHILLSDDSLGTVVAGQRLMLREILEDELKPVIGDRNKVAHGQWRWHWNTKETAFTGPAPCHLNYRQLQARSKVIEALGDIVHVLATSEPTFQRDYDAAMARIGEWRSRMAGLDYEEFAAWLQRRAQARGPRGS